MVIAEQILPQFLLAFFELMRSPLVENNWIILQWGWSIIHLIAGALIYYLVRKEKYPLLLVFELLVLFEIFEFVFYAIIPFMLGEKIIDVIWDLIIGMFGAFIIFLILKFKN